MLSFSHICDRKRRILTRSEHRNVQKAVQIVGTRTAFPPRCGIGWYGKATKGADNMKQWISLLLTVLLLALLALVAAGGYFAVTGHKLYESAIQVTPIDTLYSSISSREGFIPYAQLPQTYINAVISAEDSRFTHHKGVDPVSIARALVTDLRTGSFAEGGSTITQQLAKNTLFTQEKHLARKAAEMFAALAIEKQYNKEQIFEMYVNTIYFGSGHYGIGEAAQGYFGKTPLQLTDAEAVMLAGLPNAPSAYSPNSSPDLAVKRMQVVLNRMVGCKKLTREQADALAAEAVTLQFLPAS